MRPLPRLMVPGRGVADGSDGRAPGAGGTIERSDSNVARNEVGQDEKTRHGKPLQSPQGQAEGETPAAARAGIVPADAALGTFTRLWRHHRRPSPEASSRNGEEHGERSKAIEPGSEETEESRRRKTKSRRTFRAEIEAARNRPKSGASEVNGAPRVSRPSVPCDRSLAGALRALGHNVVAPAQAARADGQPALPRANRLTQARRPKMPA